MKRVVITGATGAIGTALIKEFIKNNIEVLVLCRKNSNRIGVIPNNPLITIKNASLSDFSTLENNTGKSYNVFYHFAWEGTTGADRNDTYMQEKNIKYMLDAVQLSKRFGCHTFVGAGSQAEYGRVEGILKADTPTVPENGYGIAKLCAGQLSRRLCNQLGIKHIWVRILSVYGPNDGANTMVTSTVNKLRNKEVPQLTKGEQMWDYLYNADAARAFYLLGDDGINGKTYVLGSGQAQPLRVYIETIRDIVAPEMPLDFGAIPYAPNQVMYLCADISELQRDTGWQPQISFEEGIKSLL